jgi:uncharacterized protein
VSRRGGRLTAALVALVALLFAGRWLAGLLADRWWAAQLSPAAATFITDWHILRLTLAVSGLLIAGAWFVGHLLLVYRAVGSVQIRRNVANLEFREALTPGVLLAIAVAIGAALGILVGTKPAEWWREVALAWQGVTYGVSDPLSQNDLGVYLAQLPLWRAMHSYLLLLVLLALSVVFGLYLLVGAVRWIEGRPAINTHARAHLGWLLAGLALTLLWGYLLEPYELVAGLGDHPDQQAWRATIVAPLLAGVALATAGLSAAWAVRPRHTLAAAGWIVLASASLVGHWMVPPALGGADEPIVPPKARERFDRMAYGLEALREVRLTRGAATEPPALPSLWNPAIVTRVAASDSTSVLTADPAMIVVQGKSRPIWLVARTLTGGRVAVSAIADDRAGPAGEPLFYQSGDSVPRPVPTSMLEVGVPAYHAEAPTYRINRSDEPGVPVDDWPRRILLAWALQAGGLLGPLPQGSRVDWRLSPTERVEQAAPFAQWSAPIPRIIDGNLVWLVDGYLSSNTFPLSSRLIWKQRRVGALRAAFLAMVSAETGACRIFLRPGADRLAEAWAAISHGLVEPSGMIPEPVLRSAPYPSDLFRAQARVLERGDWHVGTLTDRPVPDADELPRADLSWAPDSSGPQLTITFERPGERRLNAVMLGAQDEGRDQLRLFRLDSVTTVPARGTLESRWSRFPSYDALSDSIREEGGQLERGPVRVDADASGIVAYQAHFARRGERGMALAWVSVATDNRLGAGRSLKEAWSNLLGASVPAIAGATQVNRLDDARRWMERADSALRAADWVEFGQAWDGLRRTLGLPTDSAAP